LILRIEQSIIVSEHNCCAKANQTIVLGKTMWWNDKKRDIMLTDVH
jgi:hypothetical protein